LERFLHVTASHGQAALTTAVDARNEAGQTPLHLAAQCAYFRGVETLLRYGADPIAADGRGRQAVHAASLLPQHAEELLDVLSQEGCDMSAADES
jgi:ankyrin repeat protein